MCGNGGLCVERRMPASSGDPVSTALHMSLAGNKCPTLKNDDLDTKIVASARRVLLTEIQYEPAGSYSNTVLDSLKSKYIVLNPNNCDSKVEIKVKNGSKESSSPSKENSNSSNNIGSPKKVKLSDVTLPTPKRTLYPPEAIQLGWQGSTPVGSGMVNMGNTCYLNSTLQALFHVPAFVNWILNDKIHSSKCGMINGTGHTECLICAVMKTLEFTHRFSGSPIKPLQIYSKLKFICKHLVHGHQEDAHEFLRYLIESMERSYLTIVVQGTKLDNYSKETTPLNQIFGGYLRTEVTCLECRHVSTTFQHFQDLLLDIRTVGSVEDALEAYFGREQLGEGEEAYRCEQCHRRVAATKKFSIQKAPNVLCMQLKRFGILGGKISKHVSLKQKLDLSKFMHPSSSSNNELKYRLVSMISHIGPSASCGHYTAMAAASNGQFYLFDDSTVRQVQLQTVLSTNAYVIMYELEPPASVQRPPKPIPSFTINSSNGLNGKTLQNGVGVTHSSPISVHKQSLVLSPSKSERAAALSSTSPSTSTSTSSSTSLTSSSPQSNSNTASSPLKQSKLVNGLSSNASKSLVPYTPGESSDSESENATGYHRSTKQLNSSQSKNSSAISTVNGVTKEVTQKSQLLFTPSKTNSVKTESASQTVHKLNFIPSSVLSSLSKNNGSVTKKENTGNQSAVMNQLTLKKLNDDSPPTLTSSNIWLVSDATSLNSPNSSAGSSSGTSIGCGAGQWCVTEISKSRSNEKSETVTTESKLCSDTSETPTTEGLNNTSNNNNNLNCSNNSNNSNSSSSCSSVSSLSGNSSSHDWSGSVMNGSNNKNNSSSNNCSNGNNSNSKMWDGSRNNDTVNELLKFSHRGYGSSNVNSWNGGKSEVDKEVENEKHEQRKRSHHSDYDAELDRGKVKKLKSNSFYPSSNSCNGRRHNPFQDHQNRKNSWHGNNNGMNNKRHLFHRSYNNIDRYRNSNHRSYHSQNGYSNRWRSH